MDARFARHEARFGKIEGGEFAGGVMRYAGECPPPSRYLPRTGLVSPGLGHHI